MIGCSDAYLCQRIREALLIRTLLVPYMPALESGTSYMLAILPTNLGLGQV